MWRHFVDLPIRRKLTLVYVLTTAAALLLASAGFLFFEVIGARRVIVEKATVQADIIGANSASALVFQDRVAAEGTLAAVRDDPHVVAAALYAKDGTRFAAYVRAGGALPGALAAPLPDAEARYAFGADHLLVESPVELDGERVGTVRLLSDLGELNGMVLRYTVILVLVFALALAAALPVLSRLQRVISGPIMHLVEQAKIVSSDRNYAVRATRTSADELGLLVDTFNEMLGQIQQRDAALQRARATAEAANRAKDEFLAVVSHELRTPLTPILAWARMLRDRHLDEAGAGRAAEIIERNARSQAQLVEDLLDVSRITAGTLRLSIQQVAIAPVVEAAIEAVRPTAALKGVRVHLERAPDAGMVAGDAERLKQVFWNLLSNAIKFTPRDGEVRVALRRVGSHVEIAVRDTGQGIEPEFLPYVFDRFRQADSTSTRAFGGLGLGLAIVRHLVELHGGEARAESPGVGQGATFTVRLPLAALDWAPDDRNGRDLQGAGPRLDGLRVLAVDDDADTLETMRTLLERSGAEVRAAPSAQAALAVFDTWAPDVVIADIGMPQTDGYELMRQIRARPAGEGTRVPALALTAYARVEDRLQALDAGFQMHLPKPIEPNELIATVANLAEWRAH
jgi:signal transduction histidine kinase